MSTSPTSGRTSTDHADWDALASDKRRQLLLAIGHLRGPDAFERPNLQDAVENSTTLEEIVADKSKVVTSLNSTTLLNGLEDDGYLRNTFQGGTNPIVLDLEYEEDRDTREVAPFGDAPKLQTMVFDILDREGLSEAALGGVDLTDFNAVVDAVNDAVGSTVLVVVSDPSEYRLREEALSTVREKIEEESGAEED